MNKLDHLLSKKNVKIVVTDSGLGGLSVLADIESKLKDESQFENAELIFVNAFGGEGYGFNQIGDDKNKVKQFDFVLKGIENQFNPDLILVACNTLSVIFDKTNFSNRSATPVFGIVESGVSMVWEEAGESNDEIVIFGTPTTINSNVHKNILVETGISEERIIAQPCKDLESKIQNDPGSEIVKEMIKKFWDEAKSKSVSKISCLLFGCTHYGFSKTIFEEVVGNEVIILNPNEVMSDILFSVEKNDDDYRCSTSVTIYSKTELKKSDIDHLSKIIERTSSKTALALNNPIIKDDLFDLVELNL